MIVCTDMDLANRFMSLPEITRYSQEYGFTGEVNCTRGAKEVWVGYHVDGELVGLTNLHVETGAMCRFHPYILKSHSSKYNQMILEFFEWFDKNMQPEAVKLNAIIPTLFKPAIKAAKSTGFTVEGVDRQSYRTSNKVYDRIQLGITREEMKNG